jgi:ATP-dependent DNA helicase RecQ
MMTPMVALEPNSLLEIPPAALALVAGDPRKRLVGYLTRWGHHQALLAYLDAWLAAQPASVTLREGRARVLVELGRGAEALAALDALDAERPPSASRRQLRARAMAAARRFDELDLVLDALAETDQAVFAWLLRGDSLRAQGRLDDAAAAYTQAAERDPSAVTPARRLAEIALDQGDPEAARGQIDALMLRPGFSASLQDLRILLRAAELAADAEAAPALRAQIAAHESDDRAATIAALGLAPTDAANEPPAIAETPAALSEAHAALSPQPSVLLPDSAYALLRDQFGLADFRPNQARVIQAVLGGRPTLAVMPTGAGKSLTYQLPAMLLDKATVVVSPLIALMKDQLDGLPPEARERATVINSSLAPSELGARLRALAEGRYNLVYIAPERLRQRAFLHALKRCGVARFVIDEVHCLSLWGLSFRPDYLFIGRALDELGRPPILALTATATRETQDEIRAAIGEVETVTASVFRPNLFFQVLRAGNKDEKLQSLIDLCRKIDGPIIVYARARQACEELAAALRSAGVEAGHYHAQVADRAAAQERFMRGETRVLVATVAFGMGIDKPDIRAIVHYNLPQSVEGYYQEAGRAGRDGRPAHCVLLYAASDKARLSTWLDEEAISRDQLRELYRAVRRLMRGTVDVVDFARLQRGLPGEDDTLIRVGLSMLERVGLLRRHFDLPDLATLTLTGAPAPDAEAARVAATAGLEPGLPMELDLLLLAERAGLSPADLEAALLAWHDAGFLRYRAGPRLPLLELLPAPPDVAERIDRLVHDYRTRQEQRVEAMARYARSGECRHKALAAHFGQRLASCRTACDICAPSAAAGVRPVRAGRPFAGPAARDDSDPRPDVRRALDGLANLPYAMGRTGLARALKGGPNSPVPPERLPEVGALRHLTLTAVEDLIERLVAEGYVERDDRDEYRRLSLTLLGRKARRDDAYLPDWG